MRAYKAALPHFCALFVGLSVCFTMTAKAQDKEPSKILEDLLAVTKPTIKTDQFEIPTKISPEVLKKSAEKLMTRLRQDKDYTHGGGGGTFVLPKDTRYPLVFWDLYAQNPKYVESKFGDILSVSGEQDQSQRGKWLFEMDDLASARFVESRLDLMKAQMPNLVSVLRARLYELHIFLTDYSISAVREISVPKNLISEKLSPMVIPGAFYQDEAQWVYVDVKAWNRAGLTSQAALLLHERLRRVQRFDLGLSNDEIQKTVSYILTGSPKTKPPVADINFEDKNKFMSLLGSLFSTPKEALSYIPPHEITSYAIEAKILRDGPIEQIPLKPEGERNGVDANGGIVVMDAARCEALRRTDIMSGASCDGGAITGDGIFNFKTDWTEYTIEAVVEGWDFYISAGPLKIKIDNGGSDDGYANLKVNGTVKRINFNTNATYSLRVSRAKKRIELFSDNAKLGSWPLDAKDSITDWGFSSSSYGSFYSVKILPR